MNISVLTGASSGLGIEFYKELQKENLDEIWIIARREEKLKEIKNEYGKINTRILPLDLTYDNSIIKIKELLEKEKPDIKFLFNNAGFGIIGNLDSADYVKQGMIVELNNKALTELTTICLPYMHTCSHIINTCSIASFVPNARMTVYSASKAFVMSFTKSLAYELKKKKISVTAICPGPMSTEFLKIAGIEKGTSKNFDTLPYCNASKIAQKGIKAAKKGRTVYTMRFFYKFYRVVAKILHHSWLMGLSKT